MAIVNQRLRIGIILDSAVDDGPRAGVLGVVGGELACGGQSDDVPTAVGGVALVVDERLDGYLM